MLLSPSLPACARSRPSRSRRLSLRASVAEPPAAEPKAAGALPDHAPHSGKKHVVVVGSGWAAISFIKSLSNATVVRPRRRVTLAWRLPPAAPPL